MEAGVASANAVRARAWIVLGVFAATFAYGMMLLAAFEPDVQTATASELVARSDEARDFLIADYLFIGLYAIASPIAIWRFGSALEGGSAPLWIKLAALLLVACGFLDATENALMLSATDSVSSGTVDAAHAVAIPKIVLFGGGLVLTIVANVRALKVLRSGRG